MKCQQLYLQDEQCRHEQWRGGPYCRWHQIIGTTQEGYSRLGLMSKAMGALALLSFPAVVGSWVWQTAHDPTLWGAALCALFLGLLLIAGGASVIRRSQPLSELPACARAMVAGMLLTVISVPMITVYLLAYPKALIQLYSLQHKLPPGHLVMTALLFGGPLLVLGLVGVGRQGSVWLTQYLFRDAATERAADRLAWIAALTAAIWAMVDLVRLVASS